MSIKNSLLALSPLDGRYLLHTKVLRPYFSESALIKYRIKVEIYYLISLVEFLKIVSLTKTEKSKILKWADNLNNKDFEKVIGIQSEIKHDVKAVEYFIRLSLKKLKLSKLNPWVHWGLTSEDVNNLSYGLMLKEAVKKVLTPSYKQIIKALLIVSKSYKNIVMPARTHGQIAVPTTVGKELLVFASRASFFLSKIINLKLGGKLNGAVGNFNAYYQIYPEKNWIKFSSDFVKSLGLEISTLTTQIEPYTRSVYFFDLLRQINNVWLDLSQDCWLYIALDYFVQKVVKKEVGSSTMPHKVNPINFENAEGNYELCNNMLSFLSNKLSVSRLQRDLSDSTVRRNFGTVLGYSLLANKSLLQGLGKIKPNTGFLQQELKKHPEMLTEALQLFLKSQGKNNAYEKIKKQSRGTNISWEQMIKPLTKKQKNSLKNWKTESYIGLAPKLVDKEITRIKKILNL